MDIKKMIKEFIWLIWKYTFWRWECELLRDCVQGIMGFGFKWLYKESKACEKSNQNAKREREKLN